MHMDHKFSEIDHVTPLFNLFLVVHLPTHSGLLETGNLRNDEGKDQLLTEMELSLSPSVLVFIRREARKVLHKCLSPISAVLSR